jgi:hypothetical protein
VRGDHEEQSAPAQRGWRGIISSSVNRLSGDTVWRSTSNDRSR